MKKFIALEKTEIITVSLLGLVLFFRMFSIFLILPVFNILAQDVASANFFLIAVAFGIYGLTQGMSQLPAGYLSDVWGRKKASILKTGRMRKMENILKNKTKPNKETVMISVFSKAINFFIGRIYRL